MTWRPPKSRVDQEAEQKALACVREGKLDKAIEILMRTYGAALTTFTRRFVQDNALAEDVRQQVLLEASKDIRRFEGRSSLWAWLCGIAHHRSLDELRRRKRLVFSDDPETIEHLAEPVEPGINPGVIAARDALEQCLERLRPDIASQVLLRYSSGLSHVEIAEIVKKPASTVQVQIARALATLLICLRRKGIQGIDG